MSTFNIGKSFLVLFILHFLVGVSLGQGTAFTYQGKLADSGTPASGNYDFEFKLFDTVSVGTGIQQGAPLQRLNIAVANGLFTVSLDFGVCTSCFNGADRFLEIRVKPTSGGAFTTLSPRQPINATPYALKSLNAAAADGLAVACVNCVTSSQIQSVQGSQVAGTINVASVPAGSASYIQNGASQQASSNFNISGNGTAGGTLSAPIINATTHYNIGGVTVFNANGAFEGTPATNTFAGQGAGLNTMPSPVSNVRNGKLNSFFGVLAGLENTIGRSNSFFGASAGQENTDGIGNSFFGSDSGLNNEGGTENSFVGVEAGFTDTNTTGNGNTLMGGKTRALANLTIATAIGYRARVDQNNSLVLGAINGVNGAFASTNVGIGTTTPGAPLHIAVGSSGAVPNANASLIIERNNNHFLNILGTDTAQTGILFGRPTGGGTIAGIVFNSTGTPDGLQFRTGSNTTQMSINGAGAVGIGTTSPNDQLQVVGDVRVGTGTTGCIKDANGTVIAGSCSSDARLKRDITPFTNALEKLVRLQPVHFYWRAEQFPDKHLGSSQSFGLIAQEVERVMPELVAEDESGYKVVRYGKLPFLTLQAIKDLKTENDQLKNELSQIKSLLCIDHPDSAICKSHQ